MPSTATSVLVDTSVWIEFLRKDGDPRYRARLSQLIDDNRVALCGLILAELLKGARSDKEYQDLEERLAALVYLETPESLWKKSGRNASLLLRKGIQVPMTDLIIAFIGLENKIPVFHNDKHFRILQKYIPLDTLEI